MVRDDVLRADIAKRGEAHLGGAAAAADEVLGGRGLDDLFGHQGGVIVGGESLPVVWDRHFCLSECAKDRQECLSYIRSRRPLPPFARRPHRPYSPCPPAR